MAEDAVVSAVRRYLSVLPTVGIHASRAVLFGSFARGEADQYSDIDLVVIAPEFDTRSDFDTTRNLWETTFLADNRIEPIPCGEREWESGDGRPIIEIARREGVVIEADAKGGAEEASRLVAMDRIEEFGHRVGAEFGAEQVILFGSYARGDATPDSDIGILVIGSFEGRGVDKSVEIRMKLRPGFPMDLLVQTPEMVRERIEMGDAFMREILEQGKVLYEADHRNRLP
jgi:predicted nucleotidyltransferase